MPKASCSGEGSAATGVSIEGETADAAVEDDGDSDDIGVDLNGVIVIVDGSFVRVCSFMVKF